MDLYETLSSINKPDEMKCFMKDLCTPAELKDFETRWLAARMVSMGEASYRDIAQQIGASPTTVNRAAKALNDENTQGFARAMKLRRNE